MFMRALDNSVDTFFRSPCQLIDVTPNGGQGINAVAAT